jgi:hypothetical protein
VAAGIQHKRLLRDRSLAQARAVPGLASDLCFPEPTTLVVLSRSGLCVGSQDSGPNPQFEQLVRSSGLVSAGELDVRSGGQGL